MRRSKPIIIFLYFTACFCFFMALFFWFYPKKQNRIKVLTMKPGRNMTRADLLYDSSIMTPNAVMVLCPGYNGTGCEFLLDEQWQRFAKKNNLGLVTLSFASHEKDLSNGNGYYYVWRESGKIFLDGVKQIYKKDLPIILYGFSGGAHFTSRLVEWKPERVIAWCAYAAGWWDHPKKFIDSPPGIVACGTRDYRYQASYNYFIGGRKYNRPWLWVSLYNYDHNMNSRLEVFARHFFQAVLDNTQGNWIDINEGYILNFVPPKTLWEKTAWLPSIQLLDEWKYMVGLAECASPLG